MELRHLTTFRAVAATLSFTRAAAELGYVQSAVTAHVKALEDELDVRLFDRLGRRVALTDAGRRLLDYAERILALADEATTTIGACPEPEGPVAISAPEVLCAYRLPAVVRQLHDQHPKIQLLFRANPTGALDSSVKRALAQGDVDLAFVLEEQLVSTSALAVDHITSEPLVIIAAPEHPLARLALITPVHLNEVPVLLTDTGCPYRRVFERALSQAGARVTIAGEFTSAETVKSCVKAGTTIGVLAEVSVSSELQAGDLVALAWNGPALLLNSYLVWHKRRWISPAHAALRAVTHLTWSHKPPAAEQAALDPAA
jgi:DNA-binding transcriptional LysR family regulator